ncbi:hypothetical protein HK103_004742 [Boothiomyces macroporosus]|uniref:Uncharacterized protein n=1 Tax=Boothiomyces macroporosus TaxID=261099 RepID=A0AAD5URQ4_9FUNG|nr:hypothetical protein HK103_004742 [Boothiomyces macroporosus]
MTEQEQEQEFYELPPFSLTFEGKNYDLFNSLSDSNVLLFGEDYVPQTIEIPISSDEELYSSVLYESAIIYLVLELKSMLGIVNSDVIVKLPQLDLEIHEHNNCIKDRITFLHYLGERGSDVANPILVEDSEVELHYSDDSVDSVDEISGDQDDLTAEKNENDVQVINVVEKDQLAEELITEENEVGDDLIYDDGETLVSGTETQKVDEALVKDCNVPETIEKHVSIPDAEILIEPSEAGVLIPDQLEADLASKQDGNIASLEPVPVEKRELELTTEGNF